MPFQQQPPPPACVDCGSPIGALDRALGAATFRATACMCARCAGLYPTREAAFGRLRERLNELTPPLWRWAD